MFLVSRQKTERFVSNCKPKKTVNKDHCVTMWDKKGSANGTQTWYLHTCSTKIKLDCSPVHIFVSGAFAASYPVTTGCGVFIVGALPKLILDADITKPKMKTIVLTKL